MVTSEQAARDWYGDAPVSDEDPNSTAAVTDPAGASSYRWAGMQAGALDCSHLGLHVRLTEDGKFRATGRVTAIQHGASWISEKALCEADGELVLGRRWVIVTLDHKYSHSVSDGARVEFRRG